jgi:hypothetical protein
MATETCDSRVNGAPGTLGWKAALNHFAVIFGDRLTL